MALKKRIDKATFDALSDGLKTEYKAAGSGDDGFYILDVEGEEDVGALRRANQRNKDDKEKAEKEAKDAREALAELQRVANRGTGDIAALEKSWKTEAETREAVEKAKTKKARQQMAKLLVNDVAHRVANKISKTPDLLLPHIEKRLKAEIPDNDDDPQTRVLDTDGKPSALTVEQLEQEFISDPRFASIIIGSRASGGGASGNHSGGATKKPSEFTPAERTALYKSDPAAYSKLFPTVY